MEEHIVNYMHGYKWEDFMGVATKLRKTFTISPCTPSPPSYKIKFCLREYLILLLTFGLSSLRTIEPSDYLAFGLLDPSVLDLSDLLTIGPSDYRSFGLSGLWTIGPSNYRAFGLTDLRTIGWTPTIQGRCACLKRLYRQM